MDIQGFGLLEVKASDFKAEFLRPGTIFENVVTQAWFDLAPGKRSSNKHLYVLRYIFNSREKRKKIGRFAVQVFTCFAIR